MSHFDGRRSTVNHLGESPTNKIQKRKGDEGKGAQTGYRKKFQKTRRERAIARYPTGIG